MNSHAFKQDSNWLLAHPRLTNRININKTEYARLNAPGAFSYQATVLTKLRNEYDPEQEKGGLVYFKHLETNGRISYEAVDVAFVTNVADDKRHSYRADEKELEQAYKFALDNKYLPFFFHTHPTVYEGNNIVMQGMNFLQQLNTSLADQGLTMRGFQYNGVNVRLPQLLVVENSKAIFIGMYGGLIAPLCFTEQKDKAIQSSMERTMNSIGDWANTPERKAVVVFSALAVAFLAIRYPKAILPTALIAGTALPPVMYASRDRHEFFGVTYGLQLTIHIDAISDEEIIKHEMKAIEALEKVRRQREEEAKRKSQMV